MDPLTVGVIVGLASLVALACGFGFARIQDRLRVTSAQTRISEMLVQAKSQADNLQKEVELQAKDDLFKRRETLAREFDQKLNEVRDQERRLDKREDSLEEKSRDFQKREKRVRTTEEEGRRPQGATRKASEGPGRRRSSSRRRSCTRSAS